MNNIYKVIFNRNSQQFVVVSELAKSSEKSSTMSKAKIDDLFSLLFENLFGNKESISLNPQQEVRTITPNLQLPNNRIYRLNSTPNSTVLVETDPDFTNEKRWLSSDYMFNALRVEPNQAQKRLGDGFYEQRLVREQINRLTGRQFLGNYSDFDSQYRALMNAGVTFAEKFNLRVGIALSPEQVANLTSDIVWLESETVTLPNGKVEQVLVPKVYALAQKGDITGKGALLSGNQVSHSGGELINSGTIVGRELIQLDSQSVKNRGTISAGVLSGNVTGDLENLGGTLEADRAILLNVTGNITHSSTLHTTEVNNNGYQRSEITVGRKGLIHVKGEEGVLQLKSGGDFTVSGADIINDGQGQTYLSANGSFALNALQTGFDEKMGSGDHYRNQAIQDVEVSRVAGNGNVTLKGGSIYSEGADIDAKARLALLAENDIVLGTATRQTAYEEYHKTKSGSAVAKKTETRHANSGSKTQIGTVLSADNIVLSAGHDVTVTASQVVADNDVVIAAGNDVSITAGTNHFKDIYKETKKTSGAFTSGGGITFGSKSEKHEFETEGWTQSDARSAVGSLSGNVSIVAGNHAHVIGTDLIAPQENTIAITGKTLKVEAGQDIIESNEKHEFKQSGLTVGVSSSLVDTAMAVSNGVKQAKQSKNDKLSALYAMKSAQDLMHSSETVSNTIDTVGNLVNGSITPAADDNAAVNNEPSIKVSVSVGASKSQSSSHTREVTHSASELNAGNIKLTTTAGNLDVVGSHLNADKIALSSAKDINLESSQDSYQNRSENSNSGWSVGVFLGMSGNSMGLGVEGSAQFGKGKSNTDTITQSNTYLNAKEVSIESQNDTHLKGAVVNADTLNAEIGGNLTIESRQDTNQYYSEQTQAGVSASVAIYGSGSSASASFSQNKAKANSAQVEEQSGFNVGNGGMNVTVVGNTHLKGGRIASEAEAKNNYFRTGMLTTENIHNHSEMEIKNTSAGVSTNMAQMGMQAVGTALSALGNVDKNTSSTTHSAIGNNIQLEVKDGNEPTELSRDVANSNEKVTAYTQADIAKHSENQEIANLAGQVGARFVGDLSEKLNWKDGSPQKVILHGVVGLISAELSGGNNVAGAAAGVTSEYLNTKVADYLSEKVKNGELTNEERNAIQQATAAGMGAMVGSLIGGNRQTAAQAGTSALNAEKFNRQLHPDEIVWIRENAEKFAEEQGISVEDAEKRLAQQAAKDLDILWFLKLNDNTDTFARDFLAKQSSKTFIDSNGNVQNYFVAKDNEFFESRKYAKEADQYNQSQGNQFIERNLQSGIVRSAKDGAISKLERAYDTITDNPLDTGKAVAENLWQGAKDCVSQPIDCLVDVVDGIWTAGKSAAVETYHNVKGTDQESINNIYGEDVSSDMLAVSGLQLAGVAVETLGAGKVLKVGGKAATKTLDNAIDKGLNALATENLARGTTIKLGSDKYTYLGDGIFEGPNGGRVIHTGQYDPITKNAIYQRLDKDDSLQNSYWMISEDNKQIKHNKPENLPNSRDNNISWQKSESDVAKLLGNGYSSQVSYLNGKEVPHGTHGSVRLDFSNKSDVAIEVKNYDIHSNRASLVSVIAKQAMERKKHLPEGMQQNIYIDLRGQNSTAVDKLDIKNKINKQSNGVINTNNIHFLEDEK